MAVASGVRLLLEAVAPGVVAVPERAAGEAVLSVVLVVELGSVVLETVELGELGAVAVVLLLFGCCWMLVELVAGC